MKNSMRDFACFREGGPLRINFGLKNRWSGQGSNTDSSSVDNVSAEGFMCCLVCVRSSPWPQIFQAKVKNSMYTKYLYLDIYIKYVHK